jgi:hypothetical protein
MRVSKTTALILAVLSLTTVSTVAGFLVSPGGYLAPLAGPPLVGATGGIVGTISIGNVAPLCSGSPTAAPASPYYNQIQLVITPSPSSDLPLTIPLNWVLFYGCFVRATFRVGLNPGVYSLTITSCYGAHVEIYQPYSPFCSGLPKTVIVESDTWTQADLSITTGIY